MLLSIIIPAYNAERKISLTINSLLAQMNDEIEILIIDDGSVDNTANVIKKIQESHIKGTEYIKLISKINGGVSSARNCGIENAKGQYLYFLDADDFVSVDFIEKIFSIITEEKKYDCMFWAYELVDENNNSIRSVNYLGKDSHETTSYKLIDDIIQTKRGWFWTCNIIYNREKVITNNLKFTEGIVAGEDTEFIYKYISHSKEIYYLDQVLSYYVIHSSSTMQSYNIKRFDVVEALIRTVDYLRESNEAYLIDFANYINNYLIPLNVLGTFRTLLNQYSSKLNTYAASAYSTFLQEIISNYNNSFTNQILAIKYSTYSSLNFKILLFRLHPLIYYYIASLIK